MKMKFLCVFCVVLYFQSGDCLYPVNTGTSTLYQNHRSEKFDDQRYVVIPPSLKYNLHNNPPRINDQVQKPIVQPGTVRTISEPFLRQREGYGEQENSPSFIKSISEINSETPKRENNIIQGVPSEYLPIKSLRQLDKQPLKAEVLKEPLQPVSYAVPRIPLVRKDNPVLKSDEGLRLELQGVSPEYIKSLINKQTLLAQQHQDPSIIQHAYRNAGIGDFEHLPPQNDYKTSPTATFQNPSAESVYKLNQALPYKINSQQYFNKPHGKTYVNNVLLNTRRLQDIYKSEPPKKRYTIIHPDGRIEQIDDVDSVITSHPNYVMVKSDDIMKYVQGEPKAFPKVQVPPVRRNPTIEPIIKNNNLLSAVNKANNRENYYLPDTKIITPVVNNKLLFKNNTVPTKNDANFERDIFNKTNDPEATDDQPKTRGPQTISKLELNSVSEIKPKEISSTSADTTIAESDQLQNSTELNVSSFEHQNVTESNVLLNSPSTVGPNDTGNFTEIPIDTTPTPFLNESITLNDVQSSVNINDTLNLQIPEKAEEKESNDLDTSVSSTPLPNTENTTENSAFWFQADEQFWDKLINRNNTHNLIYFLFLPPRPNTEKEMKTTVYPNGTTVEEVIETINGEDGVPKIIKSTTVTHTNNTTAYPDRV